MFIIAWVALLGCLIASHGRAETLLIAESKLTASDAGVGYLFGRDVGVSGSTIVVGAPGSQEQQVRIGGAYIYTRDEVGWREVTKLTASDADGGDNFGFAVDISGDVIVVGANRDEDAGPMSGAAYVFERDETGWHEVAKLVASDAQPYSRFGRAVAVDGNVIVVGSPPFERVVKDRSGSAYVFERDETGWHEVAKLTVDDSVVGDRFALHVAVRGELVVVGAPNYLLHSPLSGAAYIFERSEAGWPLTAKLTASQRTLGDSFGFEVAIAENMIVVGAPGDSPSQKRTGAAYIFERDETGWREVAKLTASDPVKGDAFGYAVGAGDDALFFAAHRNDDVEQNAGAIYMFEWDESGWSEAVKLRASDPSFNAMLGRFMAVDGNTVVGGAYRDDETGLLSGAAYVFEK